mmetsp:Transcript_6455/g.26208  ORF Transcript_6455/g.26208 Transcript_6455/m.26208 type:complete len:707 (+) Transcript_6455:1115-3235(+)
MILLALGVLAQEIVQRLGALLSLALGHAARCIGGTRGCVTRVSIGGGGWLRTAFDRLAALSLAVSIGVSVRALSISIDHRGVGVLGASILLAIDGHAILLLAVLGVLQLGSRLLLGGSSHHLPAPALVIGTRELKFVALSLRIAVGALRLVLPGLDGVRDHRQCVAPLLSSVAQAAVRIGLGGHRGIPPLLRLLAASILTRAGIVLQTCAAALVGVILASCVIACRVPLRHLCVRTRGLLGLVAARALAVASLCAARRGHRSARGICALRGARQVDTLGKLVHGARSRRVFLVVFSALAPRCGHSVAIVFAFRLRLVLVLTASFTRVVAAFITFWLLVLPILLVGLISGRLGLDVLLVLSVSLLLLLLAVKRCCVLLDIVATVTRRAAVVLAGFPILLAAVTCLVITIRGIVTIVFPGFVAIELHVFRQIHFFLLLEVEAVGLLNARAIWVGRVALLFASLLFVHVNVLRLVFLLVLTLILAFLVGVVIGVRVVLAAVLKLLLACLRSLALLILLILRIGALVLFLVPKLLIDDLGVLPRLAHDVVKPVLIVAVLLVIVGILLLILRNVFHGALEVLLHFNALVLLVLIALLLLGLVLLLLIFGTHELILVVDLIAHILGAGAVGHARPIALDHLTVRAVTLRLLLRRAEALLAERHKKVAQHIAQLASSLVRGHEVRECAERARTHRREQACELRRALRSRVRRQ